MNNEMPETKTTKKNLMIASNSKISNIKPYNQ